MNDVILNRKVSIERCVQQVRRYHAMETGTPFERDQLRQDAVAINLIRACEQALDIANHLIKLRKLGLPKESRESFTLLFEAGLIDREQMRRMHGMVGFRNIMVHRYQEVDQSVLHDVIANHLDDLLEFADMALKLAA